MGKNKGLAVVLIFSLALNVAFASVWTYHYFFVGPALKDLEAARQVTPEPPPARAEEPNWQRLASLNLTDEQRGKFELAHVALRRGIEKSRRRSQAARQDYFNLLTTPESNPRALQAAQKEISTEEAEMRRLVFEHLTRVRRMLNEQQRREWGRMLRGMHGRRRGMPQGPRRSRSQQHRQREGAPKEPRRHEDRKGPAL